MPLSEATEDNDEGEVVPILINRDYTNLAAVFEKADVVLEVLDARNPLAYHSSILAKHTEKKRLILVVNKIGTSFGIANQESCLTLRSKI